jgi:hypothetical protein
MKIPVVPLVIAVTLLGSVLILFNSMSSEKMVLGPPRLQRVVDLDGT